MAMTGWGFQVPQVERHRWLSEAVSCAGGTQWKIVERRHLNIRGDGNH